jgi:hypothetical protein
MRRFSALVVLLPIFVAACGARYANTRSDRARLLQRLEVEVSAETKCPVEQVHAGWRLDNRFGVHACGEWLEYKLIPEPCFTSTFLNNTGAAAADSCSFEPLAAEDSSQPS